MLDYIMDIRARYKKRFLNKQWKDITNISDLPIAVDCSCEVFIISLKFSINDVDKASFIKRYNTNFVSSIQWIIDTMASFIISNLLSYRNIYKNNILHYIFDGKIDIPIKHKLSNIRKQYYNKRWNELLLLRYKFSSYDAVIAKIIECIQACPNILSLLIFGKMPYNIICIKSDKLHYYDADVYCAKKYTHIITHDLDVILFGAKYILSPEHKILTLQHLLDIKGLSTYEDLVKYCIRLGTDYNDTIVSTKYNIFNSPELQELLNIFVSK